MKVKPLTANLFGIVAISTISWASPPAMAPNVLWIYIEDQNPWYGAYGEKLVHTPNLDALANEGVVFERTYAAAPVCSPSRSALITGNYPIRIGAHDHRSSRVPYAEVHLPKGVKTVPELFRQAGYATFNRGKDDYNFVYDRSQLYSIGSNSVEAPKAKKVAGIEKRESNGKAKKAKRTKPAAGKASQAKFSGNWKGPSGGGDWRDVPEGMPFFGQYQWSGGKHAGRIVSALKRVGAKPIDPSLVTVPPQYPDIPEMRAEIAKHLDTMVITDHEVGQLVGRLKADGHWKNTIIFLFSDHGSDLPRSKEFCYQEGLHVPLLVVAPGLQDVVKPGTRRRDLTQLMDVSASSLALAGLPVPESMDSKNMFEEGYRRDYVFSSQDRMSNTIDRVRSVMGDRFHYIRNFLTDRPLMQWGHREMIGASGKGRYSLFSKLRAMFEQGKLTPAQAAPYGRRPAEELYDLQNDPDEVVNLANEPAFEKQLGKMRAALSGWIEETDDKGQYARSEGSLREITERYPKDWLKGPEFTNRGSDLSL